MASLTQIRGQYQKRNWMRGAVQRSTGAAKPSRRGFASDQLTALRHEHDDLRRAIYEAAQVQRRLCGPRHIRAGEYELASEIFPVRHLSGDFITWLQLDGDLVFAIGDIAGKGLTAGIWFTYLVGMIRRHISALGDPAAALSAVDQDLLLAGVEIPLTTLFLARLNLQSGELTYANAGHPPALLIREHHELEELSMGGPVLGLPSRASLFVNGHAIVSPGDTLLAYSDGIAESRNESGVEFGTEALFEAVRRFSASNPDIMLFSLLAAVEDFLGSAHRDDDIALLVLHRFGSSKLHG